jgi:hypothetical protein
MEKFNKVGVSSQTWIKKYNIYNYVCFFPAIDGKKGTITEGKPQDGTTAQVTITVDDDGFVDLASGKANAPAVRIQNVKFNDKHIILLFSSFLLKVK